MTKKEQDEISFWTVPVEILKDLGRDPMAEVDELLQLQAQIQMAIELVESKQIVPMTEQERTDHASRHGPGAFVVGDYVIRRLV